MRRRVKRRDPDLFGWVDDEPRKLARRADPETSFEAAEVVMPKLGTYRFEVLERLDRLSEPQSSLDIEDHFGNHGSSYRARLPELEDLGLAERVKGHDKLQDGTWRETWRITAEGRAYLAKQRRL